jgi:uncharacterized protein (TIGR03492 family)
MRLLLVSNGHGEDLSGALLGQALRRHGATVAAVPLVGEGDPYRRAEIPVLGHTRSYSTGGLGYTSGAGRLAEVLQGQVLYLLGRSRRLWSAARRADGLVVIGDVIPVLLAWSCRRPVATYLVAYSSHYEGRLRLPWPCGACLASQRFRAVFARDALTAEDLSGQLGRPVAFLGNPFMDRLRAEPVVASAADTPPQVLLLPGSRRPEAVENLALMLQLLEQLQPEVRGCRFEAALVADITPEALAALASRSHWQLQADPDGHPLALANGSLRLGLHWGRFAPLLVGSQVVVAMAGTATEQAAGLGIPVLQLAGRGPQFTAGFAEAQRRLLGPGVVCAPGPVGAQSTLAVSANLLAQLLNDPDLPELCRLEGDRRLGPGGGSDRLARAMLEALAAPPR